MSEGRRTCTDGAIGQTAHVSVVSLLRQCDIFCPALRVPTPAHVGTKYWRNKRIKTSSTAKIIALLRLCCNSQVNSDTLPYTQHLWQHVTTKCTRKSHNATDHILVDFDGYILSTSHILLDRPFKTIFRRTYLPSSFIF